MNTKLYRNIGNRNTQNNEEECGDMYDNTSAVDSGRDIYFYAPVHSKSVLTLNKKIADVSKSIIEVAANLNIPVTSLPIRLHINSGGGSLFDGFAAVDTIRTCPVPIHTIIEGGAASAATLMSVVGAKRAIHKHSFMLIHQLSSGMWGKFAEMQDQIKNSEMLMETIKVIYQDHTKMKDKQLNDILKKDIWLDAKTCMKFGLVDEVIG
jgi:ATP-dependent Clp endopeptidase proteolytic subunit ClpP